MDFAAFVHKHAMSERDRIDELCELMLVTPNSPGISVQREFDLDNFKVRTTAKLDPDVPFGEIRYLPDING